MLGPIRPHGLVKELKRWQIVAWLRYTERVHEKGLVRAEAFVFSGFRERNISPLLGTIPFRNECFKSASQIRCDGAHVDTRVTYASGLFALSDRAVKIRMSEPYLLPLGKETAGNH